MFQVVQNSTRAFSIYTGTAGQTLTATVSKNGAAFTSVAPTVTDRSNGWYSIAPIAAHRDTLGEVAWNFHDGTENVAVRVEQVIAANFESAQNLGVTGIPSSGTANTVAPLTAAGTRAAVGLATANLDTQLAAIAGYIDSEVAQIIGLLDTEIAAIKAVTDKYDTMVVADGLVYQFTANALELAPVSVDPLASPVPGAYAAGTVGYLIGNFLNAAITSRMESGEQVTLTSAERQAVGVVLTEKLTNYGAATETNVADAKNEIITEIGTPEPPKKRAH